MCTFILKSYNPNVEISKPHFFILNKGNNSGKPLISPCTNCFSIQFNCNQDKEQVFWLLFCLWQSNAFYPFLRGSVIPFISIRDLRNCILAGEVEAKANINQFQKNIEILKLLELKEKQFHENLKLIEEARKAIFYKYRRR